MFNINAGEDDYDSEESEYDGRHILEVQPQDMDFQGMRLNNWAIRPSRDNRDSPEENLEIPNIEDIPIPVENTFDLSLPASHSYLGKNLEELRGRTLLDDGTYMTIPLLMKQSILFPGQTLPLTIFSDKVIETLQNCIQNDRTFGIVCYGYPETLKVGTTAEIYEYIDGGSTRGFRLKAIGRQRFKILRLITEDRNNLSANIKVLPEITLGSPLRDQRLASLDHLRVYPVLEEDLKKQERTENLDAMVTPWPSWVYRQYDPVRLSFKIRQHLQFIEHRGGNIPKNPVDLSFWVAQNIVVKHEEKLALLSYDCAISRLQREIRYLVEEKIYLCTKCHNFIGRQSHMFPMNKEGPQGIYVNPEGTLHDTITFYHIQGIELTSPASTEYSWFPGYAWSITVCNKCRRHIGWKFIAVKGNLTPKVFWGVTRRCLKERIKC